MRTIRWTIAVTFLLAGALPPALAEEEKEKTRADVVAAAREVAAAARSAEAGNRDAKKSVVEALDALSEWEKEVRARTDRREVFAGDYDFARAWNELVTVAAYHGAKSNAAYVTGAGVFSLVISVRTPGTLAYQLPRGGRWFSAPRSTGRTVAEFEKDRDLLEQLRAVLVQKSPAGDTIRKVKIWCYRWDTLYSGVGGENTKKLARVMLDSDRFGMSFKTTSRSTRVTARRLSRDFPRAYYYFVEGHDNDEKARIRRRSYYVKGDAWTVNVEVIDFLDRAEKDDACTAWMRTVDGPECDAFLRSLAKPKKD